MNKHDLLPLVGQDVVVAWPYDRPNWKGTRYRLETIQTGRGAGTSLLRKVNDDGTLEDRPRVIPNARIWMSWEDYHEPAAAYHAAQQAERDQKQAEVDEKQAALGRVRQFVEAFSTLGPPIDTERVHSVVRMVDGQEEESTLLISDLRRLLG